MTERHPSSQRIHDILAELGELHDRKQKDYGRANDPFANVRASEEWGIPPWQGAMMRATDKLRRLQTYAQTGKLANESVIDSFNDLAVYAIIARVLYEEGGMQPTRVQPPQERNVLEDTGPGTIPRPVFDKDTIAALNYDKLYGTCRTGDCG